MPEISRFFGIVIAMYYDDHAPPHFHAVYGSEKVEFCIDPPGVLKGRGTLSCFGRVVRYDATVCDCPGGANP